MFSYFIRYILISKQIFLFFFDGHFTYFAINVESFPLNRGTKLRKKYKKNERKCLKSFQHIVFNLFHNLELCLQNLCPEFEGNFTYIELH